MRNTKGISKLDKEIYTIKVLLGREAIKTRNRLKG